MSVPRMTLQTQLVLRAFTAEPDEPLYGWQLCEHIGLASGTLYPILARLEQVGWLESYWEELAVPQPGRPRRRLYRLTREGAEQARDALARAWQARHRQITAVPAKAREVTS